MSDSLRKAAEAAAERFDWIRECVSDGRTVEASRTARQGAEALRSALAAEPTEGDVEALLGAVAALEAAVRETPGEAELPVFIALALVGVREAYAPFKQPAKVGHD